MRPAPPHVRSRRTYRAAKHTEWLSRLTRIGFSSSGRVLGLHVRMMKFVSRQVNQGITGNTMCDGRAGDEYTRCVAFTKSAVVAL